MTKRCAACPDQTCALLFVHPICASYCCLAQIMMDFHLCRWPEHLSSTPSAAAEDDALARFFDGMNNARVQHVLQAQQQQQVRPVVTMSHFLPREVCLLFAACMHVSPLHIQPTINRSFSPPSTHCWCPISPKQVEAGTWPPVCSSCIPWCTCLGTHTLLGIWCWMVCGTCNSHLITPRPDGNVGG